MLAKLQTGVKRARGVFGTEFAEAEIEDPVVDLVFKSMQSGDGVAQLLVAHIGLREEQGTDVGNLDIKRDHVFVPMPE
jgi:hypothetical protein